MGMGVDTGMGIVTEMGMGLACMGMVMEMGEELAIELTKEME